MDGLAVKVNCPLFHIIVAEFVLSTV